MPSCEQEFLFDNFIDLSELTSTTHANTNSNPFVGVPRARARGLSTKIMQMDYTVVFRAQVVAGSFKAQAPGAREIELLTKAMINGKLLALMDQYLANGGASPADRTLFSQTQWALPSISTPRYSLFLPKATPAPSYQPSPAPTGLMANQKSVSLIVVVLGFAAAVFGFWWWRRDVSRREKERAKIHPMSSDLLFGRQIEKRRKALWRYNSSGESAIFGSVSRPLRVVAPEPISPLPPPLLMMSTQPPPIKLPPKPVIPPLTDEQRSPSPIINRIRGPGTVIKPEDTSHAIFSAPARAVFAAAHSRVIAKRARTTAQRLALDRAFGRAPSVSAEEHIALQLELSSSSDSDGDCGWGYRRSPNKLRIQDDGAIIVRQHQDEQQEHNHEKDIAEDLLSLRVAYSSARLALRLLRERGQGYANADEESKQEISPI